MKRVVNTPHKELLLNYSYQKNTSYNLKPNGLWYAIGTEWIEWCESEMPHWVHPYCIEIEIDQNKILLIQTLTDLKKFIIEYSSNPIDSFYTIDWKKLSNECSGIEINNYYTLKWRLMNLDIGKGIWLSSWDVSSGCIWDLSIIKNWKCYEKDIATQMEPNPYSI